MNTLSIDVDKDLVLALQELAADEETRAIDIGGEYGASSASCCSSVSISCC